MMQTLYLRREPSRATPDKIDVVAYRYKPGTAGRDIAAGRWPYGTRQPSRTARTVECNLYHYKVKWIPDLPQKRQKQLA